MVELFNFFSNILDNAWIASIIAIVSLIIAIVGLRKALEGFKIILDRDKKEIERIEKEKKEREQFQHRIDDSITAIDDRITTIEDRISRNEIFQKRIERELSRKKVILLAAGKDIKMARSMQDVLDEGTAKFNEIVEINSLFDENRNLLIPKVLLDLKPEGPTVIDCLIEAFIRTGRRKSDIIVVSGFRGDQLSRYFTDNYDKEIELIPFNEPKEDEQMLGTLIHAFNREEHLLQNGFIVSYADLVFENFNDLKKLDESDAHISFLMEECDNEKPISYRYGSKLARRKDRDKHHHWNSEAEKVMKYKNRDELAGITKTLSQKGAKAKDRYVAGEFVGVVRFTSYGVKIFNDYINSKKSGFYKNAYLVDILNDIIKEYKGQNQNHIIRAINTNKNNKWWDIDLFRDLTTARISPGVEREYRSLFRRSEEFIHQPIMVRCEYCKSTISNKEVVCPKCRKSLI